MLKGANSGNSTTRKDSRYRAAVVSIDSGGHQERVRARVEELTRGQEELVLETARRVKEIAPRSVTLAELISAGNLGLVQAANVYDPARHGDTPFPAFARLRIRGEMINSFSRRRYKDATQCDSISDRVVEMPAPAARLDDQVILRHIHAAIEMLPPRERAVMQAVYSADEPTLREVGARLGVGKSRAVKIHVAALARVKQTMAAAKFAPCA